MIAVDRNRLDKKGKQIRPNRAWEAKAKKATAVAEQEGGVHKVREEIYRDEEVKKALEELFHRKCAYCETKQEGFDVEHYRPKGRVAENPNHPGYYWLAYAWENLLPSCVFCNQSRRDPPTWDNPHTGPAAGKIDQFPLRDETKRAMDHTGSLAGEEPLLLNPCTDDPESEFKYDPFGEVVLDGQSDRLIATVRICNLNRKRLKDARLIVLQATIEVLLEIKKARENGNLDHESSWTNHLKNRLMPDSTIHAGVVRDVVRDPVRFGIQGFSL
jgi:uncharacterized protein (TIGR02646 family)